MDEIKKWNLRIGCHRHSLTSRDSENLEFDTKAEAIKYYQDSKTFWRSIGYVVWFAEITSPNGKKQMLEQNPYQ